jgi:hypothetical protein
MRRIARTVTVTCATDGNHGRSVAWGAQLFGCNCVIFVSMKASAKRVAWPSRAYGADVIRVRGNYDDRCATPPPEAHKRGWVVVSDTTYERYRDIPDRRHAWLRCPVARDRPDDGGRAADARLRPGRRRRPRGIDLRGILAGVGRPASAGRNR